MSNQILKIKVPPPVTGFNKARVFVENTCTESSQEIDYVYLDACEFPEIPESTDLGGINDTELEDAYNECLDDIADLFCDPSTGRVVSEEGSTATLRGLTISNFSINPEVLTPGGVYSLSADLTSQGECSYRISLGSNVEVAAGTFTDSIQLQFGQLVFPNTFEGNNAIFTIFLEETTNQNRTAQTVLQKNFQQVTVTETRRELITDNDPSDANKEIYYISNTFADVNNSLQDYRESIESNNIGDEYIPLDKVRQENASFWIRRDSDKDNVIFANKIITRQITKKTSEFLSTRPQSSNPVSQNLKETYSVGDQDIDFAESLGRSPFTDIVYSYRKPYTTKELEKIKNPINSLVLDVQNKYNFYDKQYEELQNRVDEMWLPNMYYMELNNDLVEQQETQEADKRWKLDPDIPRLLSYNKGQSDEPIKTVSYYDIFKTRVEQNFEREQGLERRAKSVVVPYYFLDSLDEKSEKNILYPMGVDIRFDSSYNSVFGPTIKNSFFGEQLFLNAISIFQENPPETTLEDIQAPQRAIRTFNFVKNELEGDGRIFSSQNRFIEFNDLLDTSTIDDVRDSFVYLGDYNRVNDINVGIRSFAPFFFREELKKIIKNYVRTYKDIFDGKKCFTETMYYKIAKYGPDSLRPIQEFYLPNDPDRKTLRYVDTQVKYNKKYTYKIFSYDLVVGNIYRASDNEPTTLINESRLYIVENLYDQVEQVVRDFPPVFPQVDFYPFKDVDNRMLILLNKDNLTYDQKEVIIKDEDKELFDKARETQKIEPAEPIRFSGDDIIKKYQIFKTTKAPKSYSDFKNAQLIEVSTLLDKNKPLARASSSSLLDLIEPNTKYYYTFRCVDIHDQISNPSDIYEVEMINESGTVFPLVNIYNLDNTRQKEATKSLKRFLMIRPELLNRQLKYDTTDVTDIEALKAKTSIGVKQDSPWNKTYKMRIVSKNTNKVYDFKFKFGVNK